MVAKSKLVAYHPIHGYAIQPQQDLKTIKRNARERNRVQTVNTSFEVLRKHVPSAAMYKKLSKVNIIQHALQYIHQLAYILDNDQLSNQQPNHVGLDQQQQRSYVGQANTIKQEAIAEQKDTSTSEYHQIAQSGKQWQHSSYAQQVYNQCWETSSGSGSGRIPYYPSWQLQQQQQQQWANHQQQQYNMYSSPYSYHSINQSHSSLPSPDMSVSSSKQCFSPAINSSAVSSTSTAYVSPLTSAAVSSSTAPPPFSPAESSDSGHSSIGGFSSNSHFEFPAKFSAAHTHHNKVGNAAVMSVADDENEDDVLDAIVSWQTM